MQYEYIYPENKIVRVSKKTVELTPVTFSREGTYFEPSSIKYFYDMVKSLDISGTKIILDIGAQSGLYSLYAKYVENSFFYAFEPNEETFDLLLENLILNQVKNIEAVNLALGEEPGFAILHVPQDPGEKGLCCLGQAPLRFKNWVNIPVLKSTIDEEFYNKNIPVHVIKCDSEGSEYNILIGARKTLEKWSPELFLEVNETNLNQCGSSVRQIFSLLNSYGYEFVDKRDDENYHFSKFRYFTANHSDK